jgi:hypothetical protein
MYPVGLTTGGPFGQGKGVAASFDMIRIRRINYIDPHGRIQAASTGWLP